MATSFTINWKNILDKLENVFRTEFSNALPVYTGEVNEKAGSQYLRFDPVGSELLEYNVVDVKRITDRFFGCDELDILKKIKSILKVIIRSPDSALYYTDISIKKFNNIELNYLRGLVLFYLGKLEESEKELRLGTLSWQVSQRVFRS